MINVQDPIIDVYDGGELNGYSGSISETVNKSSTLDENQTTNKPLTLLDAFTDTEKLKTGVNRDPFFTLAPNSITKVRVYIYIEGQDVDNFDLASIGKKISVNFGFTKDRYDFKDKKQDSTGGDIPNYDENVLKNDKTAPVIELGSGVTPADQEHPENPRVYTLTINKNDVASFDPEAYLVKATDIVGPEGTTKPEPDEIITSRVQVVTNEVKGSTGEGPFTVSYLVSDWAGNYTQVDLKVTVTQTP